MDLKQGRSSSIGAKLLSFVVRDVKQGGSSSIGAKLLSFVVRQLTEDFKEENTEKEPV